MHVANKDNHTNHQIKQDFSSQAFISNKNNKLSESKTVLKCVQKTLCNMLVHSFNHYNFNKHVVNRPPGKSLFLKVIST